MALPKEKSLESTPTWAVAVFCFILVAISLVIEHLIDYAEKWLKRKRKIPLSEALAKIKSELMLLGFISLLLTVTQDRISDICVPKSVGNSWHPCSDDNLKPKNYTDPCAAKGKAQLVSSYGLHQLHIFIFVLALTHALCCLATYAFGKLKMRTWRIWEDETQTNEYRYYNDPERFRFARETSFGRRHFHFWSNSPLIWIECFFRQFYPSVPKVDYLTLRHGFITEHLPPQVHSSFDFQIYIERALEEDFKVIVGIRPVLWLCAVLFLLTNTNGWYSHLWLPFIPLAILLLVGTKLHVIITKMGTRILERGDVVRGATPLVQPSDDLFWFGRPEFMLFLIHFVLFENAFQIAFVVWSWFKFGYPSCFHENLEDLLIRIVVGLFVQILCTYASLPLYALVTQMGSKMKPIIFSDEVAAGLHDWQNTAKKNIKEGRPSDSATPVWTRPASPLHGSTSPAYLRRKSTGDWGAGGERALASPSRLNGKDRSKETSVIQIDRGVDSPSSIELAYKNQQEGNSSKEFSFARNSSTASK